MHYCDNTAISRSHRLTGIVFALLPVVLVGFVIRLIFALQSPIDQADGLSVAAAFAWGIFSDIVYAGYAIIPIVLYLSFVPQKVFQNRIHRFAMWILFAMVWCGVLISGAAEWLFWQEFGVRPNFIAVDYLIYTTEVFDNVIESYPVYKIIITVALIAISANTVMTTFMPSYRNWLRSNTRAPSRYLAMVVLLVFPALATGFVSQKSVPEFDNNYLQEIAKNGEYSFFAAFRNNELDYRKFYRYMMADEAGRRIRELVSQSGAKFEFDERSLLRRTVYGHGQERYPNVIQITIESLSANFLGTFGNQENLTPNLDRLAEESLLFTHFMATGTRTVRGMESLALSVPPTPGRSIVKRPENAGLFNIGTVFKRKGYDLAFLYGGRGYFDNMNSFFGNNDFAIHDQSSEPSVDVEFTNAWGVSDEDLYKWVIAQADNAYEQGKPFYQFVMTTSNHRPYTYPENRINIPSHTGRAGAVKYTDYAIGKFLAEVRTKPWFENTVFVFVADHCANSAGKTDLPVVNYHIPLMIYGPALIEPRRIDTISSQIDFAPTLFALLNWSYESNFYGKNIIEMEPNDERALIATYQNLGLLQHNVLTVLKPFRKTEAYHVDPDTDEQVRSVVNDSDRLDTIAYYQTAADYYDKYLQNHHDEVRHN